MSRSPRRRGTDKPGFTARSIAALAAAALALIGAASTHGIVIRHDTADSSYTSLSTQSTYDAVGEILLSTSGGGVRGTGVLIAANYVLTAAHVLDDPTSTNVSFTLRDGTSRAGANWSIHANWTGSLSNGYDIAVLELASDITGAPAASLYAGTGEVNQQLTMVGYGRTGTGTTGDTLASGTRRAGQNIADGFGGGIVGSMNLSGYASHIVFADFDEPGDPTESLMGSNTPVALEASTAPGDSGGGAFIGAQLAGITSFGASIDGATNSDYGDLMGFTRVSSFISWIDIQTGGLTGAGAIPEPSSVALLGVAGLGVGLYTGRRRAR